MNGKVRFVVTATYYNIIDQWYFDTVEKAREKYSELLVTRPNGRSGPRERSLSRKGQDSSVDELGLVALIGREERVNLGGGLEGVGLSVGLGLAAGTGTGTAPGRGLGRSL